jgi:hypothetical protein
MPSKTGAGGGGGGGYGGGGGGGGNSGGGGGNSDGGGGGDGGGDGGGGALLLLIFFLLLQRFRRLVQSLRAQNCSHCRAERSWSTARTSVTRFIFEDNILPMIEANCLHINRKG